MLVKIPDFLDCKTFFVRSVLNIYNNLVFFFKKIFNLNFFHFYNKNIFFICSFCKNNHAIKFFSVCRPDFNIRILRKDLFDKFYFRSVGKCLNCGLLQDYNRPSQKDLNNLRVFYNSKDQAVSEEIWHSYPVPTDMLNKIYNGYYKKKFLKWNEFIKFKNSPKKILFLRPTLGFDIGYFKENYKGVDCYFSDISKISEKTIIEKYPDINKINIDIDAIYSGEFSKYNNFFDLIVSNHNLVHVYDLNSSIKKINKLLKINGNGIFSNEISVKPHNPFHYNFYDETLFVKILQKFFFNVLRINDTGHYEKSTCDYTQKKDNPCFFVTKN